MTTTGAYAVTAEPANDPGPPAASPLQRAPSIVRISAWIIVVGYLLASVVLMGRGFVDRVEQRHYAADQRSTAVELNIIEPGDNRLSSSELDDVLRQERRRLKDSGKRNAAAEERLSKLETLHDKRPRIAPGRAWAIAFGFGSVGLVLLIVQLSRLSNAEGSYGIFRPLIGGDNRVSTSLTQLWLWSVVVATALGFLVGRVVFEGQDLARILPGERWDEYLILLGGPFAAAVLAKATTEWKLDRGVAQKTVGEPAPSQVFTSDRGTADLVDMQYLLFNGIALAYFVSQILTSARLPEMPAPLLALTSGTAGLYVGNKAAQRNAPRITAIEPRTVLPGQTVTVRGSNFAPGEPGDRSRRVAVSIEGVTGSVQVQPGYTDDCVGFVVPLDASAGTKTARVVSTAGVESDGIQFDVVARKPAVSAVVGPVRPGGKVQIIGSSLVPPRPRPVWVTFGLRTAEVAVDPDGHSLWATVPPELEGNERGVVEVRVHTGTGPEEASDPVEVTVERPAIWGVDIVDGKVQVRGHGFGGEHVQLLVGGVAARNVNWARAGLAEVVTGEPATPLQPGSTLHVRVVGDGGRHADHDVVLPPDT